MASLDFHWQFSAVEFTDNIWLVVSNNFYFHLYLGKMIQFDSYFSAVYIPLRTHAPGQTGPQKNHLLWVELKLLQPLLFFWWNKMVVNHPCFGPIGSFQSFKFPGSRWECWGGKKKSPGFRVSWWCLSFKIGGDSRWHIYHEYLILDDFFWNGRWKHRTMTSWQQIVFVLENSDVVLSWILNIRAFLQVPH